MIEWIQPKLHPAWPEEDVNHQDMFRGNSIYVFKGMLAGGAPFRFSTLICFDWIAPEPERAWKCLLGDLHATHQDGHTPLSWLFVLEHNPKPSHSTFLLGIKDFFEQTRYPRAFLGIPELSLQIQPEDSRPGSACLTEIQALSFRRQLCSI